jgi:hypothetical protein
MKKTKTKSNRNSSMNTLYSNNWIKDMIDNTFEDKCYYDSNGNRVRGPGIICGTWIFLLIIGTMLNIIWSWGLVDNVKVKWSDIVLQNIIDIVITGIIVSIAYNMCYICRGFIGFLVVWLVLTVFNAIRWFFFSSYRKAIQSYGGGTGPNRIR